MKHTSRIHQNNNTKPLPLQTEKPSIHKPLEAIVLPHSEINLLTPFDELEDARLQSTALHTLLIDATRALDEGTYGDETRCGILELIHQTDVRMKRAIQAVQTKPTGNAEVAA